MIIQWKLYLEVNTVMKAQRLYKRTLKALQQPEAEYQIAPYPYLKHGFFIDDERHGYILTFKTSVQSQSWADTILETLMLGRRLAKEWTLTGDFSTNLCGAAKSSRIQGIIKMAWWLYKEQATSNQDSVAAD